MAKGAIAQVSMTRRKKVKARLRFFPGGAKDALPICRDCQQSGRVCYVLTRWMLKR